MPAIAVVAGAVGAYSGAAALAAGATGLGALAAGATMVGGAMTAIGGLTGNKSLTRAGAVIGGAGALGGYANGVFGNSASNAVSAANANNAANGGGVMDSLISGNPAGSSTGDMITKALTTTPSTASTVASDAGGVINLSNSSQLVNGAPNGILNVGSNLANQATSNPGLIGSLNDYLTKYKTLVDVAGGVGQGYMQQQKLDQNQQQFDALLALRTAQQNNAMHSGANTTLPVNAVPNSSALLYQGTAPRPLQVNGAPNNIPGVA